MTNLRPIYTETNDCKDCYKCVRECPTKAIRINNSLASVVDDLCIYCGHCVSSCPTGAKKVRSGIASAKALIKEKKVYISLAPSYIAEYGEKANEFIQKLYNLGVSGVSETALGAQEVSKQLNQYLKYRNSGLYISSACPSVVELIRKYYPQHSLLITPFMSPMLTHAKMLRKLYGEEIGVIFIGPCIAKKSEADGSNGLIDVVMTFDEVNNWLEQHTFGKIASHSPHKLIPYPSKEGTLYPLEGGMIRTLEHNSQVQHMSFAGLDSVKNILENLDDINKDKPLFLELLACKDGCVNGSGANNNSLLKKHQAIHKYFSSLDQLTIVPQETAINIERDFFNITPQSNEEFSEKEITDTLFTIGKKEISDELNCSGCGYDSCREFAKALLSKHAETEMCVSYMRMVAHDKATIFLQKIPSGVVVVDRHKEVVEMNAQFANLMGEDMSLYFEAKPGLKGFNIKHLGSIGSYLDTALQTGKEYTNLSINEGGNNYQLSVFNIQKHHLITGIIQSPLQPEFRQDIVEARTREVIKKNMETVQKIAFLLGENAAHTDSLLNSILDEHER